MIGIEELQVNNRYAQTHEHCFLCFLDFNCTKLKNWS